MKNVILSTTIFVILFSSCSESINHKDVYCFLSGTNLSEQERVHIVNDDNLSLTSSGYNLKQINWKELQNNGFKNGQKFILNKQDLLKFKKIKGVDQCNITYLAENKMFLLYRYNSTFNSRYLGKVEMRYYCDMKSFHKGELGVIVDGEKLKGKNEVFRTFANNLFPVTTKNGINKFLKPGFAIESWINIRATKKPSEFLWVQNFKNDLNTSLFYTKRKIKLLDTLQFKSFNTFLSPEHVLNINDKFLNYLWNTKKSSFDIENLQTMVLNPYSGIVRWRNKIKSSFVWIPKHQNNLWQKSNAENAGGKFFHTVKSGKTGMHFSTALSTETIQKTDSLNIEFEITSKDLLEANLIIEITSSNNDRTIKYNQKIKTNSEWKQHSINFALTNAKKTDRLLIYFKNNSNGNFKVSKLQGAVIGKFITCN